MKKLKVAFFKSLVFFLVGSFVTVGIHYIVFSFLESDVFNGEVPDEYRFIGYVIVMGLITSFAAPARIMVKAINVEKERRINQWHVTGVRPEDQEAGEEKQTKEAE